jgi:hypothetical protein
MASFGEAWKVGSGLIVIGIPPNQPGVDVGDLTEGTPKIEVSVISS